MTPVTSTAAHPSLAAIAMADAVAHDVPAVLLSYQVEIIELSHTTEFLSIEKSRRTGISYAFAAEAVMIAAPAERPQNVFYIAYNMDMTREFISYCGIFAKAFDEVVESQSEFLFEDGSEKGIKAFRIDFPSGKSIIALSSSPRSLRGMQGVVIIDEASFHDDYEELLKAAMALTMWGGRVIVISTHNGSDNAFNTVIEEVRAGKKDGKVYRLTLDDALEAGLYKRICLVAGTEWSQAAEDEWKRKLYKRYGDAADEELGVIPARGSGTYLARATIEAAMSTDHKVLRLSCPVGFERQAKEIREGFVRDWLEEHLAPLIRAFDPNRASFFGQDFARSGDLSAVALGQFDDLAILQCGVILEMRNVPFREQKQVLDFICDRMPLFSNGKMDARGNGQNLAEDMQSDWGFDRIEAVMATPGTYLTYMPRLKARIDDQTMIMPRSEDVIDDLRLIRLNKGIPQIAASNDDKADGAKGKRHGDTAIALMHLVAAADEDPGPVDLHAVGNRRAGSAETVTTTRGFGTVARKPVDLEKF